MEDQYYPYIKTSQLIWYANQLTGFHIILVANGLNPLLFHVTFQSFKNMFVTLSSDVEKTEHESLETYW